MTTINTLAKVAMIAVLAVGLGACSKKKNGSTTATTPKSTAKCTWNNNYGDYTTSNGTICTPTTATTKCPSNGQYRDVYGQWRSCTPGQVINNGYTQPGGYPGSAYPNQGNACRVYLYEWPYDYYVPAKVRGEWMCVHMSVFEGYTHNTGYDDYGWDYYYAYPPIAQDGCNTRIDLGYQDGQFYGGVDFCLNR